MKRAFATLALSLGVAWAPIESALAIDDEADLEAVAPDELEGSARIEIDLTTGTEAIDGLAPLATETWASRFAYVGEQFYYSVEILGAESARTAFAIGAPSEIENYGTVIPLEGLTESVGFFSTIYPMRDTAQTLISPETGLPIWSEKVIDERGSRRSYTVEYDQSAFRAVVTRDRDGRISRYSRLGPSDLHDALSWIVDIRSQPMEVGAEYEYYIYDGWKLSLLTLRVREHTEVYTGLGLIDVAELRLTREVLTSVSPLPFADDLVQLPPVYMPTAPAEVVGTCWFSLDDRHLPVGVEISTAIGRLRLILDEYVPPAP